MVKVYVLLPVHNRYETTRRFVESLKTQTYQDFHLVLIDDGSKDDTAEIVRGIIQSLTIIRGDGNLWWGGSLQKGYEWLKANNANLSDVVLIINDDTEIKEDFLEKGLQVLNKHEKTLLLAQCFALETNNLIDAGVHLDWSSFTFKQAASPGEVNCLSTRGLFLRMSDFFYVKGFHPKLLPHYASDYEFTIRAHKKGMKLITDPSVKLWIDPWEVGYYQLHNEPFFTGIKKILSKKCILNPLMWTAFVLLACPWQWKLLNLLRVWRNGIITLLKFVKIKLVDIKIRVLARKKHLRVVVGASGVFQKGWLATDIEHLNLLVTGDWERYFKEGSIDVILAEHVWEHLTYEEALIAAKNCKKFLKASGYLRVAVPDGFHPSSDYIDAVKPGGTGTGSDDHKILYNYKTLAEIFETVGFKVKLNEWFDEHGLFHRNEWNEESGLIERSSRHDTRNVNGQLNYTSIILDAVNI